jgi:hypothetical protein
MSFIEKASFYLNPLRETTKLIDAWMPAPLKTEKAYEKSLLDHLNACFKSISVVAQYGYERCDIDLCVGNEVLIELKKDLISTGEYQRLLGQLFMLGKWQGHIIVLIVGECDPYFEKHLKANIENLNRKLFTTTLDDDFITVIRK